MKVYGYIGESKQIIAEYANPQTPTPLVIYDNNGNEIGHKTAIEMNTQRPDSEYIADENGNWVLPTPTEKELTDQARNKRDELMEVAYRKIRLIEVDIKLANYNPDNDDTPEKRNLTAWEIYLSKLDKIEQQANFPYQIDWPNQPD